MKNRIGNYRIFPYLLIVSVLLSGCATKLPIIAVQLSDDDGENRAPITTAEINTWVDTANETWKERGYKFVFNGDEDIVKVYSTLLNYQPDDVNNIGWELYRITGNYLASQLPPGKIPVYFRQRGRNGWSGPPGNSEFVSMPSYTNTCISKHEEGKNCPNGCCPDSTLLSHVLGHYLGLAHTFNQVPCAQATHDNTDGDLLGIRINDKTDDVADTAPDPGADCAPTKEFSCEAGSITLANGQTFEPPWQNFMSYHHCLPEQMSEDQAKVVEQVLKNNPWRDKLGDD